MVLLGSGRYISFKVYEYLIHRGSILLMFCASAREKMDRDLIWCLTHILKLHPKMLFSPWNVYPFSTQ